MEPPAAEFTVICIDNAWRAYLSTSIYDAQILPIKFYCETVFKCNPENMVSIVKMSSLDYGLLVGPTSNLQEIMCALEGVSCQYDGDTEFEDALSEARELFSKSPLDRKRLLMFVQGFLRLEPSTASSYGEALKGVALDVINFYKLAGEESEAPKLRPTYTYARRELDTLVTAVNDHNGNAHIKDVLVKHESSVIAYISNSILKKHLDYLKEKAAADDKNRSAADESNTKSAADEKKAAADSFVTSVMEPFTAEFTVICIDNASKAFWYPHLFRAQIEAAIFYCETVFKCNPSSKVSIVTMSSSDFLRSVPLACDIQEVHRDLENVYCRDAAVTEFENALESASQLFSHTHPDMKKRLLMFVAGTNDLEFDTAQEYGMKLKHGGVALYIFNFYLLKINRFFKNPTVLTRRFHYARLQLHELYTTVNANNNSRIDDVVVDDVVDHKSFVIDTLSEYVLQKHLLYPKEKAPADDEKKADPNDERRRAAAKREAYKLLGLSIP